MKRPTNAAHRHIIRWMDGICSRPPNIIVHITATSGTPRANNYLTLFNSNTSASPIPPSPTPTKGCTHWPIASKLYKAWRVVPETPRQHKTCNESLTPHKPTFRHDLNALKTMQHLLLTPTRYRFQGCSHPWVCPHPITMLTEGSRTPCSCRHQFRGCPAMERQPTNPPTCQPTQPNGNALESGEPYNYEMQPHQSAHPLAY